MSAVPCWRICRVAYGGLAGVAMGSELRKETRWWTGSGWSHWAADAATFDTEVAAHYGLLAVPGSFVHPPQVVPGVRWVRAAG